VMAVKKTKAKDGAIIPKVAEKVSAEPLFKKGDFCFHGDMLVCVEEGIWVEELTCFRYHIYYTGGTKMEPCAEPFHLGGGDSCWWSEKELTAITDPVLLLRASLTKELKRVADAEQDIRYANRKIESLRIALETVVPAQKKPEAPHA